MHELPVTQSLLAIALHHAEQAQAARITHLHLVIGDLASIVDESVQFYWDIISRDTLAEGAVLHFRRVPMLMQCFTCGSTYTPERGTLACSACGSAEVTVAEGDVFQLESIDIEVDD